jgi:predicted DNA binding CopG/RHH family protein
MTKNTKELAIPKGLSITPSLYNEAKKKADALGLSFSQLITMILRKELSDDGNFTIIPKDKDGYSKW